MIWWQLTLILPPYIEFLDGTLYIVSLSEPIKIRNQENPPISYKIAIQLSGWKLSCKCWIVPIRNMNQSTHFQGKSKKYDDNLSLFYGLLQQQI